MEIRELLLHYIFVILRYMRLPTIGNLFGINRLAVCNIRNAAREFIVEKLLPKVKKVILLPNEIKCRQL